MFGSFILIWLFAFLSMVHGNINDILLFGSNIGLKIPYIN